MRIFLNPLKTAVILTVLVSQLSFSGYAGTSSSVKNPLPDQQTKDWDEIIKLYKEGYEVIEKQGQNWDDAGLWAKRKQIFTEAADKLTAYIKAYLTDTTSLSYLRAKYRLGTYLEIARQFNAAKEAYLFCSTHPLIKSAQFDGKPLEPQVKDRLIQIRGNQAKRYSPKPGYVYVHRGGGNAIFEEIDIEFLPPPVDDVSP
jgi:hypothetical protein